MLTKMVLPAAALVMGFAIGSVQAAEKFSVLDDVSAQALTQKQMAQVEGMGGKLVVVPLAAKNGAHNSTNKRGNHLIATGKGGCPGQGCGVLRKRR